MRSKISVNSKAPALLMSSVCDMLDDTSADSASLENNCSGLHESLCRCVLAVYFLAENQFFLIVRKKDSEKEQKQSLSKTEECVYALNTALNKKGNKISAVLWGQWSTANSEGAISMKKKTPMYFWSHNWSRNESNSRSRHRCFHSSYDNNLY